MIKAQHTWWADKLFHFYVFRLMKKHFHSINLLGELPETDPKLPLLLLPNHSTWWDGFFIYLLQKKILHRKVYLMMLEQQLSKYNFFSKVGAYSINLETSKGIYQSLNYTLELLTSEQVSSPAICIFPQGELLPWGTRPLGLKRGVDWIIKKYGKSINVLPLAMRAEYLGEQRALVFFRFGENYILDQTNFEGMTWLERIENGLLDQLEEQIISGERGAVLLSGAQSINEKMDQLLKRKQRG